jgi:hypothetical protein
VTLLPGDAVAANNILVKIRTKLDTAWISANTLADQTFTTLRNIEVRQTYTRLSTSSGGIFDLWDRFMRWVLSFVPEFDAISTLSMISSGDVANMTGISQATLMRWYQSVQSTEFA